jgi:hypothetical protein
MKPDSELKQIAKDLFTDKIFSDRHLSSEYEITNSFPILLLMRKKDVEKMNKSGVDFIYEYYDKAMPMGVNGKPIFFSCHTLTKPETKKMFKFYGKLKTACDSL